MAKRRTRKQKEKAKHQFTLSWQPANTADRPEPKKATREADVKGQFKSEAKPKKRLSLRRKRAKSSAKPDGLASIRLDILKSLLLASLILSLEVVIYLAWSR